MKHEPLNGARSLRVVPKKPANEDLLRPSGYICPTCNEEGCDCPTDRPALHKGDGWRVLALLLIPFAGIAIGAAGVWLWRAWA